MTDAPPQATPATSAEPRLLRINEVAAELGLTTRAIRYYEEVGLLEPAARSDGDYRLYDPSDVERLRFIKSLRDDAGFSLAQIGQLLEDEVARERNRERIRQTTDPKERRRYYEEARERVDRQLALLEAKAVRLASMIDEARGRQVHIDAHLAELAGGPAHPAHDPADLAAHDHARLDVALAPGTPEPARPLARPRRRDPR